MEQIENLDKEKQAFSEAEEIILAEILSSY